MKPEHFINEEYPNFFRRLRDIVDINTFTKNKHGIDEVGGYFAKLFGEIGYDVEKNVQKEFGDHIIFRNKAESDLNKKYFLFVGHMDTVFTPESSINFRENDEYCFGNGIIDMKSGLLLGYYIAKYLADTGKDIPIAFFFNSDEEMGSVSSANQIKQLAKEALCAFVLEPAREDGAIVSARAGVGRFEITITGRSAHSGVNHFCGRNAILEMSYKIIKLEKLTDYSSGLTVNCGLAEGGTAANVVPSHAKIKIDIRIRESDQEQMIIKKLNEITQHSFIEGTKAKLTGCFTRPPMPKSERNLSLVEVYRDEARKMGCVIKDAYTGGGSDANHIAQIGCPVICGMGPVGGNAHSNEEFLIKQSVGERFSILANVILRLWDNRNCYYKKWYCQ